mmetsp:Transcript_1256/g.2694  ORF Transcript_1256/g.2694 Transcript_1256/m.2694 type:complete len:217 (-) Transcript_1256:6-656(-)
MVPALRRPCDFGDHSTSMPKAESSCMAKANTPFTSLEESSRIAESLLQDSAAFDDSLSRSASGASSTSVEVTSSVSSSSSSCSKSVAGLSAVGRTLALCFLGLSWISVPASVTKKSLARPGSKITSSQTWKEALPTVWLKWETPHFRSSGCIAIFTSAGNFPQKPRKKTATGKDSSRRGSSFATSSRMLVLPLGDSGPAQPTRMRTSSSPWRTPAL